MDACGYGGGVLGLTNKKIISDLHEQITNLKKALRCNIDNNQRVIVCLGNQLAAKERECEALKGEFEEVLRRKQDVIDKITSRAITIEREVEELRKKNDYFIVIIEAYSEDIKHHRETITSIKIENVKYKERVSHLADVLYIKERV